MDSNVQMQSANVDMIKEKIIRVMGKAVKNTISKETSAEGRLQAEG